MQTLQVILHAYLRKNVRDLAWTAHAYANINRVVTVTYAIFVREFREFIASPDLVFILV